MNLGRAAGIGAAALLALLVVSGCTGRPTAAPSATPVATPAPGATPAGDLQLTRVVDGLGLAVVQNRPDYGDRRLQLSITNEGPETITVASAVFSSAQFAAEARSSTGTDVPPGLTRFLPVDLPDAVCPAPSAEPRLSVTLTAADGSEREVAGQPADPFGVLPRIALEDCLEVSVASVAAIRLADDLSVTGTGPDAVAHVSLIVEPRAAATGADLSLELAEVRSTILLQPAEGDIWPVGRTVQPGDEPFTVDLAAVPARCDPHAVAEDKRGTFFPLTLELSDPDSTTQSAPATLDVPSSESLKRALYAYLAATCGFTLP
ncbi:hypothetical protein ACEXQB_010695 [Herbiconiux sp. P18]|uniref:hypothetical protein n=1 Tax=Herbiconiux liangxiaofengii TaxID=3342795 RepID=UPI0035B7E4D1